jgi:hypothetical protein
MQTTQPNDSLLVSYRALRQLIGILGIGLPLTILFYTFIVSGCGSLELSISAYYHTVVRDIMTGILCATGVFMITYKGYDKRDKWASRIAGVCAIGVAMFPTAEPVACGIHVPIAPWITNLHLHYASAGGLFLAFAYMSLKLFTLTDGNMTKQKKYRNKIYRACGYVILACIAIMLVHDLTEQYWPSNIKPVYWLESISLYAFGISWLTKGEAILKDKPEMVEDPAFAIAGG